MEEHEPIDEWVGIGAHVRSARLAAGLGVRELARRAEVSASHVSQVERGRASFSVRALYNVASVLGLSMDSLFEDAAHRRPGPTAEASRPSETPEHDPLVDRVVVLRADARPSIPLAGGPRWERLTPRPEVGAEFIEVVYPPNPDAQAPQDFIRHSSREYGVVVQGSLTVEVGFDRAVLGPGDSLAFDSVIPHRFWNETPDEVRAIWFIWDEPGSGAAPARADADDALVPERRAAHA